MSGCFSSSDNSMANASSMTLLSSMAQLAPTSALVSDVVIVEPIQEVVIRSPELPQNLTEVPRSHLNAEALNRRTNSNRTARRNNFEHDNFDLSIPDREDGPIPAFVIPGNLNISRDF